MITTASASRGIDACKLNGRVEGICIRIERRIPADQLVLAHAAGTLGRLCTTKVAVVGCAVIAANYLPRIVDAFGARRPGAFAPDDGCRWIPAYEVALVGKAGAERRLRTLNAIVTYYAIIATSGLTIGVHAVGLRRNRALILEHLAYDGRWVPARDNVGCRRTSTLWCLRTANLPIARNAVIATGGLTRTRQAFGGSGISCDHRERER